MELLERERYLADLTAWFDAVPERGGCIALVRGEAGIGKTVLLQKFSEQQRDARVLWGACDALFTPRPLAPLHDIARQAQGALLTAVSSGANRDAIFAAALDELEGTRALAVFDRAARNGCESEKPPNLDTSLTHIGQGLRARSYAARVAEVVDRCPGSIRKKNMPSRSGSPLSPISGSKSLPNPIGSRKARPSTHASANAFSSCTNG